MDARLGISGSRAMSRIAVRQSGVAALVALVLTCDLRKVQAAESYRPAVYSAGPAFVGEQSLVVFPAGLSRSRSIHLPFPLGVMAFSPDGNALFAEAGLEASEDRPRAGIYRIELNPVRASELKGSAGFRSSYGIAVALDIDRLVISGSFKDGPVGSCGIFELGLHDGHVQQLLKSADCSLEEARRSLSLSPDSRRIAAIYRRSLQLIDVATGTITTLGVGFQSAGWSPDGKHLAAVEDAKDEATILFETAHFTREKALPNSELAWSPDSRFLLGLKGSLLCGGELYTLRTINVLTGGGSEVTNSTCQLVGGPVGWVKAEVGR